MKLGHCPGPNLRRLQIFSEVFEDICQDTTTFRNILREIKVISCKLNLFAPFPIVCSFHLYLTLFHSPFPESSFFSVFTKAKLLVLLDDCCSSFIHLCLIVILPGVSNFQVEYDAYLASLLEVQPMNEHKVMFKKCLDVGKNCRYYNWNGISALNKMSCKAFAQPF